MSEETKTTVLSTMETAIQCLNSISFNEKPSLDFIFKNPWTGNYNSVFVFIVDNGLAEDLSSPLVQMLLV